MKHLLFASLLLFLFGCEAEKSIESSAAEVEIIQIDAGYVLHRNGEIYTIHGAGLEFGSMESLKNSGGNSFRTWTTGNENHSGKEILDQAHALGLTVSFCLNVRRERHGFDYDNEEEVAAQFESMKAEVLKYKDHPALLTWIIGNELNLGYTNPKVYDAVNDISVMIHQEDQNHPTSSTIAGINKELVDVIKARASDLDFLSIQLYGDIVNLPAYIQETNWTNPYMVTEWGATGHWEVATTDWDTPIEQNSSVKAKNYLDRYNLAIAPYSNQCIGSYVFLWGQKQERTPTWYGMFAPDGEGTETIDVMEYLWTGEWPSNQSPRVVSFVLGGKTAEDNIRLQASTTFDAAIISEDPDKDSLSYTWEIKPESTDLKEGGDLESVPPSLEGLIENADRSNISFTSPDQTGAYRLFVYVFDGKNHAAHANIPFYVE